MDTIAPQLDLGPVFHQAIHALRDAMPPPLSEAQEDCTRRDKALMAQLACLLPATPDEVTIAAQSIAASAQALDCLRCARKFFGSPDTVLKFTARAASMMTQARAARTLLARVQAERQKREADSEASERAAAAQQHTLGQIAKAMAEGPRPLVVEGTGIAAEADRYALAHRKRAVLIRALGRLPDNLDFGPLSPELVREIAIGTSAVLRSLGGKPARAAAA
jgi:hypothetical protein